MRGRPHPKTALKSGAINESSQMNVITATSDWYRLPSVAAAEGYAIGTGLIGAEYTDAYSLRLAAVAPGGRIPIGLSACNQTLFVIEGEGIASLAGKDFKVCQGAIIKVPRGGLHALRNTGAVPICLFVIHDPPLAIGAVAAGEEQGARQLPAGAAAEVVSTRRSAWLPFEAAGVQGYEMKPMILGAELTDAYSIDLMRVAPGGFSAAHTDQGRHAFAILAGQGCLTVDGQVLDFGQGDIVKVPQGSLHALHNRAEGPLEFLAIYDPPRRRRQN